MSTTALYNEMYQAGYEIACKNHNLAMVNNILSICEISNELRYEIACKYAFKEEMARALPNIDIDTSFKIACETGNINEAFEIYEKNINYIGDKKREGLVFTALHGAYNNKQYKLILKFVKIYAVSVMILKDLLGIAICTSLSAVVMESGVRSMKKEYAYIDKLQTYIPLDIVFKIACNYFDNRIIDSLLKDDKLDKQKCFASACLNGNEYVVIRLRDSGRWLYNESLLSVCQYTKYLNIVKLLVDYGADNIAECKIMAETANFKEAVDYFTEIGF